MIWFGQLTQNRDNIRDTVQRMRRFANEVLSAKDIDFTFDAPKDEKEIKLDVDLRRQIYLVFKESLNNCAKYSECTKVEIELKRRADGIFLKVSDNGKGFNINELHEGNGLINMKKRAEEIGGTFNISSEIGKGTTVLLKLPRRLGGLAFPKTNLNMWCLVFFQSLSLRKSFNHIKFNDKQAYNHKIQLANLLELQL